MDVGEAVRITVGDGVGASEGLGVGEEVGCLVGVDEGIVEAERIGEIVGNLVGISCVSPVEDTTKVNTGSGDDGKVVDDDTLLTVAVMVAPWILYCSEPTAL